MVWTSSLAVEHNSAEYACLVVEGSIGRVCTEKTESGYWIYGVMVPSRIAISAARWSSAICPAS